MIEALVQETYFNDTTRVVCPFCLPERRKKNIKDMTLTRKTDGAVVYHCHHCSASGSVQPKEFKLTAVPSPTITSKQLSPPHYDWLKSRGISKETADRMRLFSSEKFSPVSANPHRQLGSPITEAERSSRQSTEASKQRTSHRTQVERMTSLELIRWSRVNQSSLSKERWIV